MIESEVIQEKKELAFAILKGERDPRVGDLLSIIVLLKDLYDNQPDDVFLTDAEFDTLELMLKAMDSKNPVLLQVGSDIRGGKVPLPHKMGSLDQIPFGEWFDWIISNRWKNECFVVSNKADGTSALILYSENGSFEEAYSRGDGEQGAVITRHVGRMDCVPKKMPFKCAVRAEIIMPVANFNKLSSEAEAQGKSRYKNARNSVAGWMNATKSPPEFYENVICVATSLVFPEMGKQEQFDFLSKNGFLVPEYTLMMGDDFKDENMLKARLIQQKKDTPYEIDGLVVDVDNHDIRIDLYRKSASLNPPYSKKFKFGSEENVAVTTVVAVHWEPSKDGYLKPRIQIEPVELSGVTITFCTGFNAGFIRSNFIGPGAVVQVTRRGDVIPYLEKVLTPMPVENMK